MSTSQSRTTTLSAAVAGAMPERWVGAAIRGVYGRVEPELARVADFVPRGGTAVDVGAWYGPWTKRLARRADRVVAVEPTHRLADHLRAAFPSVRVVEAVASDHLGTAVLHVPTVGPMVGTSSVEYGDGVATEVARLTIDSLDLTDVRFMKFDVEGHELPALLGAAETIQRDHPVLLVELEARIQPLEPVLDLVGGWGYRGFVMPRHTWIPLAGFDLAAQQRATVSRVHQSFVRRLVWPHPRYVNSVLFRPVAD